MTRENKIYKCDKCNNIIMMIKDKDIPIICCGQQMRELIPSVDDNSKDKHLSEIEFIKNTLKVKISKDRYPESEHHNIEWIYIETTDGEQLKYFKKDKEPELDFALTNGDHPVKIYAYCRKHGLIQLEQ